MAVLQTFTKDPDAVLDYTVRWGADTWIQSNLYNKYDWVWNDTDGCYYECTQRHTSTASGTLSDDSANWSLKEDLWLDSSAGETVSTVVWDVPTGLTVDLETKDSWTATIWLSGGVAGESYSIGCEMTSDNSPARVDERTIKVKIKEK
jgi:hypothetical protein